MPTWAWLFVCFGCLLLGHFLGALTSAASREPLPPEPEDKEAA